MREGRLKVRECAKEESRSRRERGRLEDQEKGGALEGRRESASVDVHLRQTEPDTQVSLHIFQDDLNNV